MLPLAFASYLRRRLRSSAWNVQTERKNLLRHLHTWRLNPDTILPLPGYCAPPRNAPGKSHPPGWSLSNFHHYAKTKLLSK